MKATEILEEKKQISIILGVRKHFLSVIPKIKCNFKKSIGFIIFNINSLNNIFRLRVLEKIFVAYTSDKMFGPLLYTELLEIGKRMSSPKGKW